MGASRKLQGEIDRVLKRVQEGVDVFDSIWNKVYDTENANQKEKFEADLKKEIKKLQRYRDQIKTWIQSSEIKDKKVSASYEQALMDARKLIEKEMERFKICEKETKTKAFSKEGLGQQPKTDPKEKAKSETRDWLNNVIGIGLAHRDHLANEYGDVEHVSELENQIDGFEAEVEGLTVKKGKTRPPRLTHLETSITRHKAHIDKLIWILRLLDNDQLSPEQVNDVKDFLDDYVERNQEDFDEFSDVDELYSSLPLDKVESLEDVVAMAPPGLVKGVNVSNAALSMKNHLATSSPPAQPQVVASSPTGASPQEEVDDLASQDNGSDVARTPPPKTGGPGSAPQTPSGSPATHGVSIALSSASVPNSTREEDGSSLPGRKASPALAEGVLRGAVRGGLSNQLSDTASLSSAGTISSNVTAGATSSVSEVPKRNLFGAEERVGSSGMVQPLVSPITSRMMLPQVVKSGDGISSVDTGNAAESGSMAARVFSSSAVSGVQWRPGSSLQNQTEVGQFRGRTEIEPDQREKFLQRFQQFQQQQNNPLAIPLTGGHKQFSAQQQNPLLQQFNSQSPSASSQIGLGGGVQSAGLNSIMSSASLQQQPISIQQVSNQQTSVVTGSRDGLNQQTSVATGIRDGETIHSKLEEFQKQHSLSEDLPVSAPTSALGKNAMNDDEIKSSYALDSSAGAASNLPESSQMLRDIDLSPGQPLPSPQSSGSLGVIGRRSAADLGAIGDNFGASANFGSMHDQFYNLQMLEAAFYKLPQPKDSERAKSYTPRHPVVTPSSYPQVQAPIVNNPAFWERLGSDNYGTDTLFFSFYYQQNTYQQYLAARELKKQSWRYHRKYNTWFQRHEEPKHSTDDFEQGTYVYFDFHIGNDEQHGWCQRIKTDFTFEYNYLEDELIV